MSIIRGKRPDTKFYTLDKSISEDARLSWASRGLLIFLLGKPDHWEVSVAHLIRQTADALGKRSGRDAVRQMLRELEQAGYVRAAKARTDGGVFNGVDYIVSETPLEVSPETDNPAPVKPGPANPAPANPLQVSNDVKQHTENPASNQLIDSGESVRNDAGGDGAAAAENPKAAEQEKPAKAKRKNSTAMPAGFAPADQHAALAAELGVDLTFEFQKFTDYHAAKGSTYKDWGAALRTWIRNAAEFASKRGYTGKRPGYFRDDIKATNYHEGVKDDGSF